MAKYSSSRGALCELPTNHVSPNAGYSIAVERSLALTKLARKPNIEEGRVAREYWQLLHAAIGKSAKKLPPSQKLGPTSKYRPIKPYNLKIQTINQGLTAELLADVSPRRRQRVVRELVLTLHEILRIRQGEALPLILSSLDDSIHEEYAKDRAGRPDNSFVSRPKGSCGPIKQDALDAFDAFQIMDTRIKGIREVHPVSMLADTGVVMFKREGLATPSEERQRLNASLHCEGVFPAAIIAGEATLHLVREYKGASDIVGSYPLSQAIDIGTLDTTLGLAA